MIIGLTIFDYINAYYPLVFFIIGLIFLFKWWME
jgi:hypothetical protein